MRVSHLHLLVLVTKLARLAARPTTACRVSVNGSHVLLVLVELHTHREGRGEEDEKNKML